MNHPGWDDVIRVRIDIARAVEQFQALLDQQAREGETRAPARPAATAVWRELAPFRLIEYDYVDPAAGPIDGAWIGFPDGGLFVADEDIPERAVDDLLAADPTAVYVYILPRQPVPLAAVAHFLAGLESQIGHSLVGVIRDDQGSHAWPAPADPALDRAIQAESGRHLDRTALTRRITARLCRPDGRAYAALTHDYVRRVVEFGSAAERDAFVAWTRTLCDRLFARGDDPAAQGFPEAHRPAEPAPVPDDGVMAVRLTPPGPADLATTEAMRSYWRALRHALAVPDDDPRMPS